MRKENNSEKIEAEKGIFFLVFEKILQSFFLDFQKVFGVERLFNSELTRRDREDFYFRRCIREERILKENRRFFFLLPGYCSSVSKGMFVFFLSFVLYEKNRLMMV